MPDTVAPLPELPPITLLSGDLDGVIPPAVARATETWPRESGAAPTFHLFQGSGYGIDDRVVVGVRDAASRPVSLAEPGAVARKR